MILRPDKNLKDIYEITPEMLKDMGIHAMLIDLDSTTMQSKTGEFTGKTIDWFNQFKKEFYMCIVQNNKNKEYIEARKRFHSPLYQGGKFLPYERVGDTLYFGGQYGQVNILYKGVVVDEDGLPEITDKEALAIATYCAYVTKFKEGLRTNNQNIIQLSAVLKRDWNTQCDQARVAEYLNQNEMDQILEAKTSWNRKIHNKSYKVFK